MQSQHSAYDADLRLISQVELLSINARVFDSFGADLGSSGFSSKRHADLQRLAATYDKWRLDWSPHMSCLPEGDVQLLHRTLTSSSLLDPQLCSDLYFYAAKLHLYSHVFRGRLHNEGPMTQSISIQSPLLGNSQMQNFIHGAIVNAVAIVRSILGPPWVDEDQRQQRQRQLAGLPLYLALMTAFASLHVLRTVLDSSLQNFMCDSNTVLIGRDLFHLLQQMVDLFGPYDSNTMSYVNLHSMQPILGAARSIKSSLSIHHDTGQSTGDETPNLLGCEVNHGLTDASHIDFDCFLRDEDLDQLVGLKDLLTDCYYNCEDDGDI